MGANFARDLASGELPISLEDAILVHLTSNHYPPLPTSLVPVAVQAIEAVNASDPHAIVRLPLGHAFRGYTSAEAHELVEGLHLEAWVENNDD